MSTPPDKPVDFIRAIVTEDLERNKHQGKIATRFPQNPMAIYILATPNPSA
jgi:hypothetical protein